MSLDIGMNFHCCEANDATYNQTIAYGKVGTHGPLMRWRTIIPIKFLWTKATTRDMYQSHSCRKIWKKPHKRRAGDIDLPQEVLACCVNLRQLVPYSVANIYLPIIDALITLFYHASCLLLFNISSQFAVGAKTVICLTKWPLTFENA